jgi:hypothetical protein
MFAAVEVPTVATTVVLCVPVTSPDNDPEKLPTEILVHTNVSVAEEYVNVCEEEQLVGKNSALPV